MGRAKSLFCQCAAVLLGLGTYTGAWAMDEAWKAKQIADALSAGPPTVTADARVYGWDPDGKMVLLRHGSGAYACMASGNTSTRVGKPPLPFPDPMCLDQNAWNFFQVLWSQKNPMKPSRPYPTAPGMVWMLAGMGLSEGMVKIGSGSDAEVAVTTSGQTITRLSPHVMIMPLPMNEATSGLGTSYDPNDPEAAWVMMRGTPIEHLMVHFSDQAVESMMRADD